MCSRPPEAGPLGPDAEEPLHDVQVDEELVKDAKNGLPAGKASRFPPFSAEISAQIT